jgi:hypothetical protein
MSKELDEVLALTDGSLKVDGQKVTVLDEGRFSSVVGKLVEVSALGSGAAQGWSRYLVRMAALNLGIAPASIHELYMARGREKSRSRLPSRPSTCAFCPLTPRGRFFGRSRRLTLRR